MCANTGQGLILYELLSAIALFYHEISKTNGPMPAISYSCVNPEISAGVELITLDLSLCKERWKVAQSEWRTFKLPDH